MPLTAIYKLTEEELAALKDAIYKEENNRRANRIKKAEEMFEAALKYCEENGFAVESYVKVPEDAYGGDECEVRVYNVNIYC